MQVSQIRRGFGGALSTTYSGARPGGGRIGKIGHDMSFEDELKEVIKESKPEATITGLVNAMHEQVEAVNRLIITIENLLLSSFHIEHPYSGEEEQKQPTTYLDGSTIAG